jgi:hypothetical protein
MALVTLAGRSFGPTARLMASDIPISFGDNVRVRSAPETVSRGLAGLAGQVRGETTPSVTGVEVIGEVTADFALCVHFDQRGEDLWFAPQLLEFVDHAPGTAIRLEGVAKQWVRTASGDWQEIADPETPDRKPWWKFW